MPRPIQMLALALLSTAALTAPNAEAASPAKAAPVPSGPFDAELDAWEKIDMVKDPKGDMAKLIELQKRILANPAAGKAAQARVLGAMGAAAFYMQDFARAAELMEQSSAIWEAMGNQIERISEMENNRAAILRAMGKLADAEIAAKKAVEMRRRIYPDPSTEIGMAIYNLGSIYMSMGRFEEAAPLLREAARHQEQAGGDNAAAMVTRLSGLASALNEAGQQDEAVTVARRSVQIAGEKLGDGHQLTSVALNNLGTNLNDAGRYQEAIPVLREALRVRVKTLGENHAWTAYSLRNLAFALEGSGKLDESQALNEQALAIFKHSPETTEPWALSRLLGALALTASVRQDWDRYDRFITEAMAAADARLAETSSDRAYTHVFHASVLTQRGRLAEALPIAEKWVPVISAAMNPAHRDRIWAELLLARLRLWKGDSAAALPLADAAVAQLTKKLSSFGVGDRQLVREAEMNHKSALLLLDLAIAAKDEERTFAALQLATISDLALGQQFNRDGAGGSGPAIEARRAVLALARREAELGGRQARAVQTRDPAAPQLAKDLAEIRTRRDAAEADLRARFPEFAARYRPSPVSLATVRSRLNKDQVLVIIAEGPLQSQAVAFTAKGMDVATFDTAPALKLANRLREAVDGPANDLSSFPYADAHALYQMIMPKQAQKARQLLLHGGRELASLPLGMLTTRTYSGKLPGAPWLAKQASVRVIGNLALFNKAASPPAGLASAQALASSPRW
ncbi:tetratricopeptide repeat protein [Novosphingobium sp. MW5]|nr:tetratricopeptide repeat protein [Novosphingobium sp. MW5]